MSMEVANDRRELPKKSNSGAAAGRVANEGFLSEGAPTCDTAGVLNGIVGAITGIASTEALKILLKSEKISREIN